MRAIYPRYWVKLERPQYTVGDLSDLLPESEALQQKRH